MATDLNIAPIFSDFYRPHRFRGGRKFSIAHLFWTTILPAGAAVWLSFKYPMIDPKYQITLLTVFGVIAAVMTALLPVVQYVVGADIEDKGYTASQRAAWQHQVDRLQVLRGLYAAISVAVVLLVFSLVPLTMLQIDWLPDVAKQVISGSIYFVGFSVAVSFLQVVSGTYMVLESQAKQVDQKLKDLAPKE